MTLLTAGYWQTTYWAEDYYHDDFWADYSAVGKFLRLSLSQKQPVTLALSQLVSIGISLSQEVA